MATLQPGARQPPPACFAEHLRRYPTRGGCDVLAEAAEELNGASAYDPRWAALKGKIAAAPEAGAAAAAFRGSPARLDRLIEVQAWRPGKFALDRDGLHYREFFAVSDLAGVRVEDPEVFTATQSLPLSLVEEGIADGLRVDHIEGLRDPKAYLHALREGVGRYLLLVEKILAPDETLPADWGVDGTTGYKVANLLIGLVTDQYGAAEMECEWCRFTGEAASPEEMVLAAKREVLERMLASKLEALAARVRRLGNASLRFRDVGPGAIRVALVENVAALQVYRTYANGQGIRETDRARLIAAVAAGRTPAPWVEPNALSWSRQCSASTRQPGPRTGMMSAMQCASSHSGRSSSPVRQWQGSRGHSALPFYSAARAERSMSGTPGIVSLSATWISPFQAPVPRPLVTVRAGKSLQAQPAHASSLNLRRR